MPPMLRRGIRPNILLNKEISGFKQGDLSIVNYYAKFEALWRESALYLSPKPSYVKEQVKLPENQHIFELLVGVNPKYETICAQALSQDLLPPIGMVFVLL